MLELASDEPPPVPTDLRDRVVATATARAGQRPRTPRRRRRPAVLAAAAAALAGVVLGAGAVVALTGEPPADAQLTLDAPAVAADPVVGRAELRETPAGVRVDLEASGLSAGEDVGYYHVWLEWPSGNRISAGTFVPDADWQAVATLTCGGELADYEALAITAHSRDAEPETVVRTEL